MFRHQSLIYFMWCLNNFNELFSDWLFNFLKLFLHCFIVKWRSFIWIHTNILYFSSSVAIYLMHKKKTNFSHFLLPKQNTKTVGVISETEFYRNIYPTPFVLSCKTGFNLYGLSYSWLEIIRLLNGFQPDRQTSSSGKIRLEL